MKFASVLTFIALMASLSHAIKKKNAFKAWLSEHYPHLDDQELDIWISNLDKKSAKDMLEQYHVKDKDIIASANDL
jgi:hypothetical protein